MDIDNIAVLKDLPEVVVVMLCIVFIVKFTWHGIIEGMKLFRESAKERHAIDQRRNEIDARRNELDEKNVQILESVAKRLETVGGAVTDLKDTVVEENKTVVKRLDALSDEEKDRDTKMKEFHEGQYKAVQTRLDVITERLQQVIECTRELPKVAEETQQIFKLIDELKSLVTPKDEEQK